MGRGRATVIVAVVLLVSVGGAAVVIWQAKAHGVPPFYVLGPLVVVLGIGFSALNLGASDQYLRQHFGGEENATQVRRMWRGWWVGMLIGMTMIAFQYFLGGGP